MPVARFVRAHDNCQATRRPVSVARVATSTALLAKKKRGRGGGNNEGAQPRERKEKDDVIEVWRTNAGGTAIIYLSVLVGPAPVVVDQLLLHVCTFMTPE